MGIPKMDVKQSFLNNFRHLIQDKVIDKKGSKINLFMLPVRNGDFDYKDISKKLSNEMVKYCLSKNRRNEYIEEERFAEMVEDAADKFRNHASNEGELGELLLYCLLESHLKAPKLISKMILKTSTNDYVKRADGIHILKVDDINYQLLFGESKLNKSIKKGIKEAFKSIDELITRGVNNIESELLLINTHLRNELDDSEYEFVKNILFPSEEQVQCEYDNSFGILIGFEIEIPQQLIIDEGNIKVREWVEHEVKRIVEDNIETIAKEIRRYNLMGYNCYIYAIPFTHIAKNRKNIIKRVKGE